MVSQHEYIQVRPGAVFRYERAGRSANVGRTSNWADRSQREREGALGTAVITAEVRYSLVTKRCLSGNGPV